MLNDKTEKNQLKKIDNKNLESTELTWQAREMSHKTKIIIKKNKSQQIIKSSIQ
jgi:hypothetical protein